MKPWNVMAGALACCVLVPSAAQAANVGVTDTGRLSITGTGGESSMIEVRYRTADEAGFLARSDRIVITDDVGLRADGPACVALSATTVSCDSRPVKAIAAELGGGNDVLVINASRGDGIPSKYPVRIRGGAGNDVIRGGVGAAELLGQAGRDVVAGWVGDDLLTGGPGADGLIGFSGDDTLLGQGGRDAIFAQKGRDRMSGGPQNDVLLARDGVRDRRIDCGDGAVQRAVTDKRDPDAHGPGCAPENGKKNGESP